VINYLNGKAIIFFMKLFAFALFFLLILPAFSESVEDVWDSIVGTKTGELTSISCDDCENLGSVSRGKGVYDLSYETEIINITQGMQINCLDIIVIEKGVEITIDSGKGEFIIVTGPQVVELFGVQQNAYLGTDLGDYASLACISKHGKSLSEGFFSESLNKLGSFLSGLWTKIKELVRGESFGVRQPTATAGVRG
jgi:hypothetical protein